MRFGASRFSSLATAAGNASCAVSSRGPPSFTAAGAADSASGKFSPEAMTEYFREVYWALGAERLDAKGILKLFAFDNGGTEFAYRTAAERFRMIESGMVPVIMPRDERAQEAIARLGIEAVSSGRLARDLQHYTVDVPPRARARLIACGRAAFVATDLRADQFCVLSDLSLYREDVGLVWEDAEFLGVEALVLT